MGSPRLDKLVGTPVWHNCFHLEIYISEKMFNKQCMLIYISTPSTRKGSHAENSVSFQMFLILLYSITLGSESQIPVFKQCLSNT